MTEEKKSNSQQPLVVSESNTKCPFAIQSGVSFVNTDNFKNGNELLYILGGAGAGEKAFLQLTCHKNSITFDDFKFNKNIKSYENATLSRLRKTRNGRGIAAYLINDENYGNCIIILNPGSGYSCYCCDNDKWIVQEKNDIDMMENDNARSLLVNQS